jgi:hypothetical protein
VAKYLSDFWWLDEHLLDKSIYLELGHIDPTDDSSYMMQQVEKCQVNQIEEYRRKFGDINVFRSLRLSDKLNNGHKIMGPFIVDIDNENEENGLVAAHKITRQLSEYLVKNNITDKDFRILFSGHKGFGIEIKPGCVNISGSISDQIIGSSKKTDEFISYLRQINTVQNNTINVVDNAGTIIDSVYGNKFKCELKLEYTRLHNSVNSWKTLKNTLSSRRKIELCYKEFGNASLAEIINLAKYSNNFQ